MRTPRIFQFPPDPAKSLLSEFFDIMASASLDQLRESSSHEFSAATVGIRFQAMPIPVSKTQTTVQFLGKLICLLRPSRLSP
jgi:hypothetical protein